MRSRTRSRTRSSPSGTRRSSRLERLVAYVVAGLFILFLVLAVAVLASVGAFRAVDVYLPSGSWATWLVFGGVFMAAGLLLLSLRR